MYKIIDHPLIKSKLSIMRDKKTNSTTFRTNLTELAQFMAYEVTKDLKTVTYDIQTPLEKTKGYKLKENVVLVPILRAGLGMLDGFKNMLPDAPVGFIGLYRNEKTFKPVDYYCKMPDSIKGANVLLLDPMLATGHSSAAAIAKIKQFKPKSITFVCIVSAPQGIKVVEKDHPEVPIFTASLDRTLNAKKYILPGLGDAGDRIFGTK
ncbi:MAG: uracil phosphoribosyltransferase [Mycoplasmoidaceae bacterium]|nr:uracil phosphoribosyltransferase [Mycoplasmoidaceae bacterium]